MLREGNKLFVNTSWIAHGPWSDEDSYVVIVTGSETRLKFSFIRLSKKRTSQICILQMSTMFMTFLSLSIPTILGSVGTRHTSFFYLTKKEFLQTELKVHLFFFFSSFLVSGLRPYLYFKTH